MNKEMLNICYKFFNRFITSNELVEQLSGIKQTKELKDMIANIKRIMDEVPNVEDDYVKQKKAKEKELIKKLEQVPKEDEEFEFIHKSLEGIKKDHEKELDCVDRWFKVVDYINKNDYFNKCYESMNDEELLEFICQNIAAPFPPQLTQEEFDRLVKAGIEKDAREKLWRLAFNYENSGFDFSKIVDYYLEVKDGEFLAEFIDIVGEHLDIDNIIDRVNDKKMIEDLNAGKPFLSKRISEEQFERLNKKDIR